MRSRAMAAARELISDAILSGIKKTPSQSSRATKVKEIGQEISCNPTPQHFKLSILLNTVISFCVHPAEGCAFIYVV